MKTTITRYLFTIGALAILSGSAANAATIYFTGTCADCPDIGEGVLTTTEVGSSTIFEFTYTSDWITYTMTNAGARVDGVPFSGLGFALLPGQALFLGQNNINITSFGGVGNPMPAGTTAENAYFFLGNNGDWETGGQLLADFGINGAFSSQSSSVPEPSALGLAGLSAGVLLARQWKRRREA